MEEGVNGRNSDVVFWMVLVDLLIQIIFVGLLVGHIDSKAARAKQAECYKELQKAKVPNDWAMMEPAQNLLHSRFKDFEEFQKALGGRDKPNCRKEEDDSVATFVGLNDRIRLENTESGFAEVLGLLDLKLVQGQELELSQFRKAFSPLLTKRPDCRYFVKVVMEVDSLAVYRAIDQVFYVKDRSVRRQNIPRAAVPERKTHKEVETVPTFSDLPVPDPKADVWIDVPVAPEKQQ